MKVQNLIDILSEQDPDAEVLLVTQRSWPFEHSIAGVTCRSELVDSNEESDDQDDDAESGNDRTEARDVLLVEGRQLRYGNANAWNVAHRWARRRPETCPPGIGKGSRRKRFEQCDER